MKNILLTTNTLCAGGAEILASNLAIEYKLKGFNVSFICYGGIIDSKGNYLYEKLKNNDINILLLNKKLSIKNVFSIVNSYVKFIKEFNPQVIHSHLDQSDLLIYFCSFFVKDRIYLRTLHTGSTIKRIPNYLHRKMSLFYTNIACSKNVKSSLKMNGFIGSIDIINNGVPTKEIIKSSIKPSEKILKIGLIGNMKKVHHKAVKGHQILINAVCEIKEFLSNKATIHFFGTGELEDALKKDVRKNKVNNIIKFHGLVNNINKEYSEIDLLVAPSLFEGLPLTCIEAGMHGTPLLTSNISAFNSLNVDSRLKFDSMNYKDLSKKLVFLINNYETFKINAINNRNFFLNNFSIEKCANEYISIFKKIEK